MWRRVANLRKTGITQILVGALDDKMLSIAEEVVLEQGVLHLGTDWAAIRAE